MRGSDLSSPPSSHHPLTSLTRVTQTQPGNYPLASFDWTKPSLATNVSVVRYTSGESSPSVGESPAASLSRQLYAASVIFSHRRAGEHVHTHIHAQHTHTQRINKVQAWALFPVSNDRCISNIQPEPSPLHQATFDIWMSIISTLVNRSSCFLLQVILQGGKSIRLWILFCSLAVSPFKARDRCSGEVFRNVSAFSVLLCGIVCHPVLKTLGSRHQPRQGWNRVLWCHSIEFRKKNRYSATL